MDFSNDLLLIAIAQLVSQSGYEKVHTNCSLVLIHLAQLYITQLSIKLKNISNLSGSTQSNLLDIITVFEDFGIDTNELLTSTNLNFARLEPASFPLNIDSFIETNELNENHTIETIKKKPFLEFPHRFIVQTDPEEADIEQQPKVKLIANTSLSNDIFLNPKTGHLPIVSPHMFQFNSETLSNETVNETLNDYDTKVQSLLMNPTQINRAISFKTHLFNFIKHTFRENISDIFPSAHSTQSSGRMILDDMIDVALPLVPNLFSASTLSRITHVQKSSNKIKLKFVST